MSKILAVHRSPAHTFSKQEEFGIRLLEGLGVEGDAHMGRTVKHRSRVAVDPTQPNLRQVHLLHVELFTELEQAGFHVRPGDLGENVTTTGIDLLALPTGTRLLLGQRAIVELTGLRNPCVQIDRFQKGLMSAVIERDEHGGLIRKAGVMAIVLEGGEVWPGDGIVATLPPPPHQRLERV